MATRPLWTQLRLGTPCQARWADMPGDAQQRFCGQCQKTVHVLTGRSDAELRALAAASPGGLCGRVAAPEAAPEPRGALRAGAVAGAALLLGLGSVAGPAQADPTTRPAHTPDGGLDGLRWADGGATLEPPAPGPREFMGDIAMPEDTIDIRAVPAPVKKHR
jgi:hypothetical protein